MADKEFKTTEEQLDILRERGLTITDENKAKDFLLRNNYYRISGYSLTLRKNDVFSKSATFQNIVDIYNFDHELRHIIPTDIFNEMKSDIVALTKKYPFVRMKYYGFRDDWQQML